MLDSLVIKNGANIHLFIPHGPTFCSKESKMATKKKVLQSSSLTRAVLRKITQQCSAEGSPAVSYLCAQVNPGCAFVKVEQR